MNDELKTKLWMAAVSALMVIGGLAKSEFDEGKVSKQDAVKSTDGNSWIAKDFEKHTQRDNELQRQIDDLREQLSNKK